MWEREQRGRRRERENKGEEGVRYKGEEGERENKGEEGVREVDLGTWALFSE
uniref:Uncharacterized protein n=1 Tax=Nelumbo nucifera TaxID=4432 RepID=A0A822ZLD5_NELNU|nr:TPA_asm: hypothetical protein HUJ06_000788 [Nelumbo nucifera]